MGISTFCHFFGIWWYPGKNTLYPGLSRSNPPLSNQYLCAVGLCAKSHVSLSPMALIQYCHHPLQCAISSARKGFCRRWVKSIFVLESHLWKKALRDIFFWRPKQKSCEGNWVWMSFPYHTVPARANSLLGLQHLNLKTRWTNNM